MKSPRYWLFLTLGLLLGAGCDRFRGDPGLHLSGTLELTEHAVGARAAGRLQRLLVDEGQAVKAGEVLGTLDRYEQTSRDYERVSSLYKQGGTTEQTVEQAALALDDQRIVSPVDGVILLKLRESGEVLPAGAPVVVIGDRQKIWVRVYVPEGQINRVRIGQPATVRLDGVRETFKGHVIFIATRAEFTPRNIQTAEERVTQAFAIKVLIDQPPSFLRPGVAADVTLELDRPL